jgi:hypothetical protein
VPRDGDSTLRITGELRCSDTLRGDRFPLGHHQQPNHILSPRLHTLDKNSKPYPVTPDFVPVCRVPIIMMPTFVPLSQQLNRLLVVSKYDRSLTPRCERYRQASPQGFSCRPTAGGGLTGHSPMPDGRPGHALHPTDALDFHQRLLPEVFGTVGKTSKGMTIAAREQRKRGDRQV